MVDAMVKEGSADPEPDDLMSHEDLSVENLQPLPSTQSLVQPSENVVEMVEKSIQTDNRVKIVCYFLLTAVLLI